MRVWDPVSGDTVATLEGHTNRVVGVAWGEIDGQPRLATASYDGTVRVWDPVSGDTVATLEGHTDGVVGVAWGEIDGQPRLATASYDTTVRVWDPVSGDTVATLEGHTSRWWVWRGVRSTANQDWPPPATTGRCGCGIRCRALRSVCRYFGPATALPRRVAGWLSEPIAQCWRCTCRRWQMTTSADRLNRASLRGTGTLPLGTDLDRVLTIGVRRGSAVRSGLRIRP